MKKIIYTLCILLCGVCVGFLYQFLSESYFFTNLEQAATVEEFVQLINENIEQGKEEATFIIENISEEELANMNQYLDGFYGNVDSFRSTKKNFQGKQKVTVHFHISDNFYACQYFESPDKVGKEQERGITLAKKVDEILGKILTKDMDEYEKELAIHDYLVKNCEYEFLKGEKERDSYSAYGALIEKKAVCNGYAEAMQLMLKRAGILSRIVVGNADNVDHAWNIVKVNGEWYQLDATWNDPVPNKENRALHTYFNVTDEMLGKNHVWEKENYPACNSEKELYYKKNNSYCKSFEEFKIKVLEQIKTEAPKQMELFVEDYNKKKYDLNFVFETNQVEQVSYQPYGTKEATTLLLHFSYY
ncbi:MAG: transglutaminase domain-containing protein [Lachnospiraceae bacterium]|nr:hypothetical protein [Lachnospiraceae bacterium]MEE1341126.1 transglutaminase domain-containing protein [Lachnospiraceae bacterium]